MKTAKKPAQATKTAPSKRQRVDLKDYVAPPPPPPKKSEATAPTKIEVVKSIRLAREAREKAKNKPCPRREFRKGAFDPVEGVIVTMFPFKDPKANPDLPRHYKWNDKGIRDLFKMPSPDAASIIRSKLRELAKDKTGTFMAAGSGDNLLKVRDCRSKGGKLQVLAETVRGLVWLNLANNGLSLQTLTSTK
jgi:hypothetical protein